MTDGVLETSSPTGANVALAARLTDRRKDIQCQIYRRIREIPDELQADAVYFEGLRTTVAAVVEYVIKAIESEGDRPLEIPSYVAEQARLAARTGIEIEIVLNRYVAGSRVLQGFIIEEATLYPAHVLTKTVDLLGSTLERLVRVAGDAHKAELERLARSSERREAERIERLLRGELVEHEDGPYKVGALWHISVIATGCAPRDSIDVLASELGCEIQVLQRDERTVWAWLGSPAQIETREVERVVNRLRISGTKLAMGESQHGLRGWRESHRQAQAALLVAHARDLPVTRWFDASLEALALQDESYARRMISIYLGDLAKDGPRMRELRQTLEVYLANGQISESVAALLRIDRRTVYERLKAVDEILRYDKEARHAELAIALRIYELLEGYE